MSDISINISFDAHIGSEGTGNGEFKYPSGITVLNDEIFVVDKQNHRIQVFNLSGVYQRQFGTVGSGNDQFYFPEGITNDGTDLYIVDSGNHRIKKHQTDGTFLSEFGGNGSGNDQFDYPVGINYDGTHLWIADKQNHRVKKHHTNGNYISKFGSYGTGGANLNHPEDVVYFQGGLVVCDSGNKQIKFFSISGAFVRKITGFGYPVGIQSISDSFVAVIDRTNQEVIFYDENGVELSDYGSNGSGDDEFYFPQDLFYYSDKLYITDSGNHRVKSTDFTFTIETPKYVDEIVKMSKQLYPTGRAFWLLKNSIFWKFHEGLAYSESRAYQAGINLLDNILPDNDNFTAEAATNWERALGLLIQPSLSLSDRKAAILRKINHPGIKKARQDYRYIQAQLQLAGFDVYVHENSFDDGSGGKEVYNPIPAIHGICLHGQTTFGHPGLLNYTKIANSVDEAGDASFYMGNETYQRFTFFISAEIFPNFATVDADRKREFRELIMKLKPAHSAGFLLITYT